MNAKLWRQAAAITRCFYVLAAVAAIAYAKPAEAAMITIEARGTVTAVTLQGGGLELYFPSVPKIGDSYIFRYTYESTTPDAAPADLSQGLYTNALTALSLSVVLNPTFNFPTLPRPSNLVEIGNTGAGD